jgi:MFS transporter, NNP family, nitrate/nitrite transporter
VPAVLGLYLYLPAPTGLGVLNMWIGDAADSSWLTLLLLMKLVAFGRDEAEGVAKQFAIFRDKHTWAMTAAVHRHLRIVHRLLDGIAAVDQR